MFLKSDVWKQGEAQSNLTLGNGGVFQERLRTQQVVGVTTCGRLGVTRSLGGRSQVWQTLLAVGAFRYFSIFNLYLG